MNKSLLKPSLLLITLPFIVLVTITGCQKPSLTFGNSLVNSNNTTVGEIDSSTLILSTVMLDSFQTAGSGTLLLGRMQDPYFGNIVSKSFLQFGTPSFPGITNQAKMDSIELVMFINKYYYGDTTEPQTYYVSQLNEIIQYPYPTQFTYFNNDGFSFNPNPIGSATVTIFPTGQFCSQDALDSVKIRLNDTLGLRLLEMMENNSDTVTSLTTFHDYFPGVVIYTDSSAGNTGVIFGMKDSAFIRLYYEVPDVYTDYFHVDFPYNNRGDQFNQISVNRAGTPLAVMTSLQASRPNPLIPTDAPSSLTGNQVYVQGATGIETKIGMPYVDNVTSLPDYLGVLKATLTLKPIRGTYTPEIPLPPQLILSQSDENNGLGSPINLNGGIEYGSLTTDFIYGENTSYTYDVTAYVQAQVALGGVTNNALILSTPPGSLASTVNRAVFGDQSNPTYNIKLQIYYISLIH
jgi:hypothetical protein